MIRWRRILHWWTYLPWLLVNSRCNQLGWQPRIASTSSFCFLSPRMLGSQSSMSTCFPVGSDPASGPHIYTARACYLLSHLQALAPTWMSEACPCESGLFFYCGSTCSTRLGCLAVLLAPLTLICETDPLSIVAGHFNSSFCGFTFPNAESVDVPHLICKKNYK